MKFRLAILLLLLSPSLLSQYEVEDIPNDSTDEESSISWYDIKQKTYVGGDFSLRFGAQTYLYLAPMIGYDIKYDISAGFNTMYQLFRVKYSTGAIVSDHAFGAGVFVRYRPLRFLLAQAEFDVFNVTDITVLFGDRVNIPAFQFGLGYAGELGERAYYNLMLMYDFIQDPNMPLPQIFPGIPLYLKYGFVWYLA